MDKIWFVFDLDDTLIDFKYEPFKDTKEILEFLKSQGFVICLASFNTQADVILEKLNLREYFHGMRFNRTQSKVQMIKDLAVIHNRNHVDAIFFDDEPYNFTNSSNNFIHSVMVQKGVGVTLDMVKNVINKLTSPVLYCNIINPKYHELLSELFKEYRLKAIFNLIDNHDYFDRYKLEGDFYMSIVEKTDSYGPYFDIQFKHIPTGIVCKARSCSGAGVKHIDDFSRASNYRLYTQNILYITCCLVIGQMEFKLNELQEFNEIYDIQN